MKTTAKIKIELRNMTVRGLNGTQSKSYVRCKLLEERSHYVSLFTAEGVELTTYIDRMLEALITGVIR